MHINNKLTHCYFVSVFIDTVLENYIQLLSVQGKCEKCARKASDDGFLLGVVNDANRDCLAAKWSPFKPCPTVVHVDITLLPPVDLSVPGE